MNPFISPIREGFVSIRPVRLIPGLIAALIAGLSIIPSATAQHSDDYYRGMARGLELFGEVYREIVERYAGDIDPGKLAESAIRGMITTLDRHSAYVSPETGESTSRRSLRVGIGIEVDTPDGMLTVTEVLEGHAARAAGIRVGDRVIAVDGKSFLHSPPEALYAALRGEIGSTLRITIGREGLEKELTFTLARERVRVPSVRYAGIIEQDILFIRLERFGENAGNEFRTDLFHFLRNEASAGNVSGIILDLRGNSGGILEEAVRVAEAFVPKGELIVETEGRDTTERERWLSERDPIASEIPLILLVDRKTASASELVAAAIQDHDLGVIVGEPTVGKGVIQSVRGLPFGASIRLTTAWYVTPSGRSIQRIDGLLPNEGTTIIPDSLLGTFRTAHGRAVESGVGIVPDTILPSSSEESIIARLERINAFFHFASFYTARLDSLPATFKVDNGTLLSFEEYALGRLLEYEERQGAIGTLDSLQERLSSRRNEKRIARLFDDLSRAIIADDETQFADAREEIRRRLEAEIAGRFRSGEEQIGAELLHDPPAQLGIALLRDSEEYRRLLGTASDR